MLGERAKTLGSSTEGGGADPSWAHTLRYDKEIRKKQAKLINEEGRSFEEGLVAACKGTETCDLFLTGPTIQAAALARHPPPPAPLSDRERTPRGYHGGRGQRQRGAHGQWSYNGDPWHKGKDKGASWPTGKDNNSGKGSGGRGRGTGFVRNLLAETPIRPADLLQLEHGAGL